MKHDTLGKCDTNAVAPKTIEPPSAVDREISILDSCVDSQDQLLDDLSKRLDPILTRNTPTESNGEPDEAEVCVMAGNIRAIRRRLEMHNRIIQNLLERLEI